MNIKTRISTVLTDDGPRLRLEFDPAITWIEMTPEQSNSFMDKVIEENARVQTATKSKGKT